MQGKSYEGGRFLGTKDSKTDFSSTNTVIKTFRYNLTPEQILKKVL